MSDGAPAIPVIPATDRPVSAAPALRVIVVSDGRPIQGGPTRPVYVVTDNRPTQGNTPVPVVLATGAQASRVLAGPAIPVVVVSGSLNPAPINTVLPVISGTMGTLSATNGTWTNSPSSFAYQWKRNGVDIGGATASTYVIVTADIGTTLTVAVTATNASGSTQATSAGYAPTYTQKIIALAPAVYFPMAEAAGATVMLDESGNGRNGAYKAAGEPLLGQTGIGDGRTAALFDGTNDFANMFSAALAAAIPGTTGTIICWWQIPVAAAWTDATMRTLFRVSVNASNQAQFSKNTTSNRVDWNFAANAVSKNVAKTSFSPTTWQHAALTWKDLNNGDQMIAYINGVQEGATQTGAGAFIGTIANAVAGASNTTPTGPWKGLAAHIAIWPTALSAAQIATLAVVP